ncbi:3-phosphoshikimate 1-carboxyvinyltransferase [candidate division WOR-3 bacterium]|nr:3-phosphoshikimate 1-carboxyvinyltransferase [candidate division WOR-3 bacterium]
MRIAICAPVKAAGSITVSGDKSISHRALLVGAIARGATVIRGHSHGNDCRSTLTCLRQLGIDIKAYDDRIEIHGSGLHGFTEPADILDCGNSGTTMRLLTGVLSGQDMTTVLTGDVSLRSRPMNRVIEPLRAMDACIWSRANGRAPLSIRGRALRAMDYTLPVASAQVKSALIFAGMLANGTTTIKEPTMTRDHTERMLLDFGAALQRSGDVISIAPGKDLHGQEVCVPGDISSAAFFIILASIAPGSRITIENTGVNPTRAGIIDILRSMGADITRKDQRYLGQEPVADLVIMQHPLQGVDINGAVIPRLIDELPIIAVAATQAHGTTRVQDAQELRHKETDRIRAIVLELQKMGAKITEQEDGFIVHGPCDLHGATCSSHHDHRIAMALAIAGTVAQGETRIENAECIDISFPEFIPLMKKVCGEDAIRISA